MYDSGFAVKVLSARLSLAAILRILVLSPYPGLAFPGSEITAFGCGARGWALPPPQASNSWMENLSLSENPIRYK